MDEFNGSIYNRCIVLTIDGTDAKSYVQLIIDINVSKSTILFYTSFRLNDNTHEWVACFLFCQHDFCLFQVLQHVGSTKADMKECCKTSSVERIWMWSTLMARWSHEAKINISNTMVLSLHSSLLLLPWCGSCQTTDGLWVLFLQVTGWLHLHPEVPEQAFHAFMSMAMEQCTHGVGEWYHWWRTLQTRTDGLLGDIQEYSEEYPGF